MSGIGGIEDINAQVILALLGENDVAHFSLDNEPMRRAATELEIAGLVWLDLTFAHVGVIKVTWPQCESEASHA